MSSLKRSGDKIINLPPLTITVAWIKLGQAHEDALIEATEEETAK